jgi:hypothetical protein
MPGPGPDIQALLLEIREANDGVLTAQAVVDAARDPLHPLHQHFEWDDEKGAEKYRVHQARQLIRIVKLVYVDKRGDVQKMRVFHSVSDPDSLTGRSYMPLDEIEASDTLSAQLLRSMEIDWRNLHRRYKKFAEFRAMVARTMAEDGQTGTDGP